MSADPRDSLIRREKRIRHPRRRLRSDSEESLRAPAPAEVSHGVEDLTVGRKYRDPFLRPPSHGRRIARGPDSGDRPARTPSYRERERSRNRWDDGGRETAETPAWSEATALRGFGGSAARKVRQNRLAPPVRERSVDFNPTQRVAPGAGPRIRRPRVGSFRTGCGAKDARCERQHQRGRGS
jgi:hypothetical protein